MRSDAAARRLLPLLIGQPVVNSGYVQQRLGINAPAAQRALRTLTERGVVVERTGYARNRIWEHRGLSVRSTSTRTPSREALCQADSSGFLSDSGAPWWRRPRQPGDAHGRGDHQGRGGDDDCRAVDRDRRRR